MKLFKRSVAVLLALLLLLSCFSALAFAYEEKKRCQETVTIFLDGINAEDLIDLNTTERVFPPEVGPIVKAVVSNLSYITKFVANKADDTVKGKVIDAVIGVLGLAACNEYGEPDPNTGVDYLWPTPEELSLYMQDTSDSRRIRYCFDWRLDMMTLAEQLHDFIEYVLENTGAKNVDLIGFSMGTCVVSAYLKLYDYEYIRSVAFLSGAYQGASVCGEPFSGKIGVDPETAARYTDSVLLNVTQEFDDALISALMHELTKMGVTKAILDYVYALVDDVRDIMFTNMMGKTLATMPGMWSLIPEDDYEDAKALHPEMTPEFEELIDWYHYEVQNKLPEIIRGAMERGINAGIVCQYGFPVTPCIEDVRVLSDSVIDTKYESIGATCADIGETLGEDYVQKIDNGHNCISPDRMIDSSTCEFCDYTWFIKNTKHGEEYGGYMQVLRYIMDSEVQPTVWDGVFPQYLVIEKGVPVPQTEQNSAPKYSQQDTTEDTAFELFADMMKNIGAGIRYSFEQFIFKIKMFFENLKNFTLFPCPLPEEETTVEADLPPFGLGSSL